jgi:tetratricopeptide (TPR) repeat protein
MKKSGLFILLLAAWYMGVAQSTYYEDSLRKELSHARTVPDKLRWMHELGDYYTGLNNQQAEEVQSKMIALADSSRNREWMVQAFLYNADQYFSNGDLQLFIDKGLEYTQKALDMARSNNLGELTVWSYLYMARGLTNNGENDKALKYSNLAMSMVMDYDDDSLKTYVYNTLGDTYLEKNEKLLAFRSYLQAMNIAEQSGTYKLLNECYKRMTGFYRSLEDFEKAKDFAFRRETLLRQHQKYYELLDTWRTIGRLYLQTKQYDLALKYFEKTIVLANSLHFEIDNINSYSNIVDMYLISGQHQKSLEYYNTHTELKNFLIRTDISYYIDHAYGVIYMYMGHLDSAGYYLKKAEKAFENNAQIWSRYNFYTHFGMYYRKIGDYDNAIVYWTKAKTLVEQIGDLGELQRTANKLDSLYQFKGDYKTAYFYHSLHSQYKDSLEKLSKEKDLMSLEIDSENRRKEREAKKQEEDTIRRHNIQYMGITIAIAAIFIVLVMAGAFSVSRTTIKILGFFAFIFLFEFIIMIADNKIHHVTHGEPWKVLAIKIGLIAILLPLHHWLEEKAFHYLTTQKLLRIKGKGLVGKWFRKKDADLPIRNV